MRKPDKNFPDKNVLLLNIKTAPFNVMVAGEKKVEYREIKKWMNSRLFDKEGNPRKYDLVKFVLAYSSKNPYFYAPFLGVERMKDVNVQYSSGYSVKFSEERWGIKFGKPILIGNLRQDDIKP
jgi:hypothetical protein